MNIRKRVVIGVATLALAGGAASGGVAMAAMPDGHPATTTSARQTVSADGATAHVLSGGVGNIRVGSSNHHGVWCVQRGINDWHKRTKHSSVLSEDGKFGSKTLKWVKAFQKASKLSQDGIVGKKTGNSLLDNLQSEPKQRAYCYKYLPSTHR
jgi:peptidoglycan hydrolase-like protein with peptidoglycan-binding domain